MKTVLERMYYTSSMKIVFYFDPSCPFCWITSRWLLTVTNERDVQVTWKPFSLAIKNELLDPAADPHCKIHKSSHRVLRVMMAAKANHGASLIELYSWIGSKFHIDSQSYNDELIIAMLEAFTLPVQLLRAADDTSYDSELRESIQLATNVAGKDVGVPTIVFTNKNGDQQGFFGPVLQELPEKQAGLELWDGLSKIATNSSFYELKRSRPGGLPDVQSTAV